jgi:hypothetical protein
VAALTPTSVPAVPSIEPDLPSDADDDDDEEIPAAEMPPPQGDLDDEDAEEPAPLPPAPLPPAPPATPPPAPARAPSLVGIGVRMPARNRQPPGEWWKLSPAQLVGNPDDSDDEEADIAQCLASSSTHRRSFADALRRTDAHEWRKAALTELDAHKTNGTWILVPRPKNRPVIGSRWVFTQKYRADGSFERYKGRLVAQGFSQRPGFEYLEVFAPTVRLPTLRIILALAALHDLHLWSVDVSNAYLNGDMDCNVYMEQPEGVCLSRDQSPRNAEERAFMHSVDYGGAIGSLQYLSCITRPDIAYTVGQLASFTSDPGVAHWNAIKHLFRYIKCTIDYAITYSPDPLMSQLFTTYSDANHGGCKDTGRSTGAYIVKMGTGVVSWMSKRQSIVALSTTEAEYMAACEAGKEIVWMRKMLQELGFPMTAPSVLYMDNQSAIQVAKHLEHHGRMKQLDLSWFWLRDVVDQGAISPTYIPTGDMTAHLLTKALPRLKVEQFCQEMGLGAFRGN